MEVVDDGIGISREHLPRCSNLLPRGQEPFPARGGTGLIVKHIIDAHGSPSREKSEGDHRLHLAFTHSRAWCRNTCNGPLLFATTSQVPPASGTRSLTFPLAKKPAVHGHGGDAATVTQQDQSRAGVVATVSTSAPSCSRYDGPPSRHRSRQPVRWH